MIERLRLLDTRTGACRTQPEPERPSTFLPSPAQSNGVNMNNPVRSRGTFVSDGHKEFPPPGEKFHDLPATRKNTRVSIPRLHWRQQTQDAKRQQRDAEGGAETPPFHRPLPQLATASRPQRSPKGEVAGSDARLRHGRAGRAGRGRCSRAMSRSRIGSTLLRMSDTAGA